MHARVAAVVLAKNAHKAEDCLAVEDVIGSERRGCKWWWASLPHLAGAEVNEEMCPLSVLGCGKPT